MVFRNYCDFDMPNMFECQLLIFFAITLILSSIHYMCCSNQLLEATFARIHRRYTWCERLELSGWSRRLTVRFSVRSYASVNFSKLTIQHCYSSSMLCQDTYPCNVTPGDIVVNGIILLAYECGRQYEKR